MSRRVVKHFVCRRCGASIPDYLTFGVGVDRNYCLHHIPRWVRLRMWIAQWVKDGTP